MNQRNVREVTLNGKTGKPSIARSFIAALNYERIITEKGGFLFKPLSRILSSEDIRKHADVYVIFARFLLENGYSGQGRLDTMTVSMLREAGLFNPVPENLTELALVV